MYQYRNVLVRMRQGDSDRDIARSKTMGRKKLAQVREMAGERGWLAPERPLPDDGVLAALFARKDALPANCLSTLEPWREQVTKWHAAGIQGTTIHATLARNHGYTGSYSSMHRFLSQLTSLQQPDVPLRLTFKPAEAVQVDFGAGPLITDVYTGEIFKTWFLANWERSCNLTTYIRNPQREGGVPITSAPRCPLTGCLPQSAPAALQNDRAQGTPHPDSTTRPPWKCPSAA